MSNNEHLGPQFGEMRECHDCGHVGEALPKTQEQPWHKCSSCGSGITSSLDHDKLPRALSNLRSMGFDTKKANFDESGNPVMHYRVGQWIAKYGGRHIEISHSSKPDSAVDVINTYDYEKGEHKPMTPQSMQEAVHAWVRDYGQTHMENM